MDRSAGQPRVLVVLPSAARRGAEIQGEGLSTSLTGLGWDVRAVALVGAGGSPGLDVPVLGASRFSVRGLWRLRSMCRGSLVVAHGSSALLSVGLATLGTGTRWVYRSIGDPRAWTSGTLQRRRSGWFLRRASRIVVLWPAAGAAMEELYGVDAEVVEVIPNDRNPARFRPPSPGEREAARVHFEVQGFVVVLIAALNEEKRPLDAVRAIAALENSTLLVVGDGPMRHEVQQAAAELGCGRVRLTGVLEDPWQALAAADALLLPSRTEGMPGVIIEALMSEVPVVATRVGAVASMISEGATGFTVDQGDVPAMTAALRRVRDGELGELGAEHHTATRRYESDRVTALWSELLKRVAGSSS